MRFTPKTEEEAAAANLLPKGDYDAVVRTAVDKVSKTSGNDMIELELVVYGPSGEQKLIRDYLVATDGGQAKIQRFCRSAGMWDAYQAGELYADGMKDASVRVKVKVEAAKGDFGPKNGIADYLPRKLPVNPQADRELRGVDPAKRTAALASQGPPTPDAECPF